MGPQQGPEDPFQAGRIISARDLNAVAENAWRGAQVFAAGKMRVSRVAGGPPVLDVDLPDEIFARITGQGSGCAYSGTSGGTVMGETAGPNCYCGLEWSSDKYGGLDDLQGGLIFDAFGFPLVEMTGRDDVPVDAIVRAYRARAGDHYEFIWTGDEAPSGSASGSGGPSGSGCMSGISLCELVQCINGQLQVACGCLFVTVAGKKHVVQYEFTRP